MKYYKYAIAEAEYEKIKAQYLAYKKNKNSSILCQRVE